MREKKDILSKQQKTNSLHDYTHSVGFILSQSLICFIFYVFDDIGTNLIQLNISFIVKVQQESSQQRLKNGVTLVGLLIICVLFSLGKK